MKAGLFLTGLTLATSASAQLRHGHRHGHKKRGDEAPVAYETVVEYATATAPAVIVYVDSNGNPISTGAGQQPAATPYSPPAPAPEKPAEKPAPPAYEPPKSSSTTAPAAPAYNPPKTSSTAPAAPAYTAPSGGSGSGSGSGSDSGSGGQGITYSPYNTDNSCKSADQVKSDFGKISGYNLIRLYGSDCNQVANVLAATKAKLFVGIFDPINNLQTEADQIIKQVNGDWSQIDTISIGNELVNGGKANVGQVTGAIGTARGIFKGAGFTGSIVTVDTFVALIANPGLCQASDYAAANCHAFFDGGKTADQAGDFVKDQAQRVSEACGGKKTVITESGWPSEGSPNGAAVPSKENQQKAVSSLKSKFSDNIYLFTAFNDLWKQDFAGSFGCEKYWGILSS